MAHYSSSPQGNRAAARKRLRSFNLPDTSEIQRERHSSHRTKLVRIRGLALDPPSGNGPIEVCVNNQDDWDLIYKTPAIHVKCSVESCDTLLTAKRMSRSGLRFFAVRSGSCSHNLVEMPVGLDEVVQDPSKLAGGGGPEGKEHLWIKGRLFKIARKLGIQAVVEHSLTRADVYLPEQKLVLEYQRWDTDYRDRTAQRASAGAARTVWMFPWQPPNAPRTKAVKEFNREVFQHGGIYVAVRNKDVRQKLERPWEDPAQERTARLYASGSIAVFDHRLGALVRKERSLATVLSQIISGDRVLVRASVLKKSNGRKAHELVWVLRNDLTRAVSRQEVRAFEAKPLVRQNEATPATRELITPTSRPAAKCSGEKATTEAQDRRIGGVSASSESESANIAEESNSLPNHPESTPYESNQILDEAGREATRAIEAELLKQLPLSPQPERRRPWWKSIADWIRQI